MTRAMLREYVQRWGQPALAIAVLLTILLFLASLLVIYIGDEYVSPAWSEQSVPPPRTY
jgi:TRAP-type C4-dicarboxylate transport system permease small subunit